MIHRFAGCELNAQSRELHRDGRPVHVQPRVLDLLLHLIAHRDRVVPKSELIEQVWDAAAVSDAALVSAVRDARSAVGDDGRTQAVVRTVPRVGFRFVAGLRTDPAPPDAGPDADEAPGGPERWCCETRIELAEQRVAAGDYHRGGRELFLLAADQARAGGWSDLLARAALGLGEVSHGIGLGDRALVALLEDAIDAVGDADREARALRARLRGRLAVELGATAERGRAERLGGEALDAAAAEYSDAGRVDALLGRLMVLSGRNALAERRRAARELIAVASSNDRADVAAWGHHFAIACELEEGDRARLDAEAARAIAHDGGLHHTAIMAFFETGRAIWEGRFPAARRLVGRLTDYDDSAPLTAFRVNALAMQGWLCWLTGDPLPADWRRKLHASAPPEFAGAVRAVDAFVASQLGDLRCARAAFDASVRTECPDDMFYLFTRTALAHVAVALEDVAWGERLYAELLPWADRVAVATTAHYLGSIHRAVGGLDRLAGRSDAALEHLTTALGIELRMRARPFAALSRRDLGAALLDAGQPAAAVAELQAALAEAQTLEMAPLRASVGATLRERTGKRPVAVRLATRRRA